MILDWAIYGAVIAGLTFLLNKTIFARSGASKPILWALTTIIFVVNVFATAALKHERVSTDSGAQVSPSNPFDIGGAFISTMIFYSLLKRREELDRESATTEDASKSQLGEKKDDSESHPYAAFVQPFITRAVKPLALLALVLGAILVPKLLPKPDVDATESIRIPIAPSSQDESRPRTISDAGKFLDQSILIMRDLSRILSDVNDEVSAREAAPRITEKVAALNAIDEESKALGMTEEQGQELFPEKFQQLKQMSLLMQGHMQRLSLDVPTHRTVSDAWQKGQSGKVAAPTSYIPGAKPVPSPIAAPTTVNVAPRSHEVHAPIAIESVHEQCEVKPVMTDRDIACLKRKRR